MKRSYLTCAALILLIGGCTDKFDDFNTDKKNPAVASGNALFTNGQKELADQVNQVNVNQNVFKLWAQYWTETTYTDEANYDIVNRNIPVQVWRYYYRASLKNLNEASRLIEEETGVVAEATKQNRLAIIELVKAYAYGQLVDIFGMTPYTDALDIGNVYPKYDDGAMIYADLLSKVNGAISVLSSGGESFGSADLYYGGDVDAWIKFANTLKIKFGITLADVNPTAAKTAVESGVTGGPFESSDDDCLMRYLGASPNQNPLYEEIVASGRKDYVVANTIVDAMNALNDPRRAPYFTIEPTSGNYVGGPYGVENSYSLYSHIDDAILAPDFPGLMMTYTEMAFYLAEAAERGFTVGGTAEEWYNEGVTSSILEWGGSQAQADAYLLQVNVAYLTAPDSSTDGWREKIGTQSWIANYTKGLEAYTTWRRLDYPIFNIAPTITSTTEIPKRMTFPIEEQTLNPGNWKAASDAIGGDDMSTPIFWDMFEAN